MRVKDVVIEDFCNYRLPSMFIVTDTCSFKCEGCQNTHLVNVRSFEVSCETLFDVYSKSRLTRAIVFGGLEPFDQAESVFEVIRYFREHGCNDMVVIYTGYEEDEIAEYIKELKELGGILLKIGRYKPDRPSYYNKQLGVELASDNQYVIMP